ncbi:MAG: cation diffusion facilitator family transporter [Pseudohongiellaceae bacterium]
MNPWFTFCLPEDKKQTLEKAKKLEWITLFFLLTIVAVMYFAMGSSQAMKTALLEDILSMLPPVVFLVAIRFHDREANTQFPYGYRRALLLAFLAAAVAVLGLGVYIFYDSAATLFRQEHPTLGHMNLFGWFVWSGWVMMAALVYSMIAPVILGRIKLRYAKELHEKTLYADATMNKADWITAATGVAGIIGIGFGLWWADAVAALVISTSILKDGFGNVRTAASDLMDQRPVEVASGKPLKIEERITDALLQFPGIIDANVRIREEGQLLTGEAFVVIDTTESLVEQLQKMSERASNLDWRVQNLIVVPVKKSRKKETNLQGASK